MIEWKTILAKSCFFVFLQSVIKIDMKKTFTLFVISFVLLLAPLGVSAQMQTKELTNLVIFMRFADDDEIDHSFDDIDTMFNAKTPGYLSIYNFYDALSYGKIHYNTIYTNNVQDGQIVSYVDSHPRGYFEPYSSSNPIGYQGELPFMGICMREAELLASAIHYVDSLNLVDDDVVLDGDGDGDIDNISFIVKGGVGSWASMLWPHMEYFPHDSIDYPVEINGVKPNTFNLEFEGAPNYFTAHVFRHEMGHSLDMPDLYHYTNYTNTSPAGYWDMMCNNYGSNHTAAIYKNKILHVADDPIQITEDGDYTLLSVGSSPSQNCYYIKSAIDSTQWYVFEYRRQADLFEGGIPGTGLIVARWNDTVTLDYNGMFANAFFDFYNVANQYWIFRPGSADDRINGNINTAHFSHATGRTSFGPNTNPHPYLTDGTPENSFEITDIHENGNQLTFHVHFFGDGIDDLHDNVNVVVKPNPATDRLVVEGEGMAQVELLNMLGQVVSSKLASDVSVELSLSNVPSGLYLLRATMNDGTVNTRKVVKK